MFINMRHTIILAVLLSSSLSLTSAADDDITAQWLLKKNNTANSSGDTAPNSTNTDDEDNIDLTPSGGDLNDKKCLTDDKELGECVPYYLCDTENKTIIDDGFTLIDVRQRQCYSYLEVCCAYRPLDTEGTTRKDDGRTLGITLHDLIPLITSTPANLVINDDKMKSTQPMEDSSLCGWDVPELFVFPKNDSAIYANYGEFPWAVALIKKSRSKAWSPNDYLGGGTLIHPSVVLTVAHKVDQLKPDKIKIRAGEWDTQTIKEKYKFQERDVKKIIIHPKFFKTSLYYDVALLILESPFDLDSAPHISTACIGKTLPPPGTNCFSMGWGPDFNNEDNYATILKKVHLPLVGSDDCTEKLRQSRLGPYYRVHDSLTCAGGVEGVDTCQGDGGSSLVCPVETRGAQTRYAVYGAVAYGIDCGKKNRPGVYAKIPAIKEWLDQEMVREKYGTAAYSARDF